MSQYLRKLLSLVVAVAALGVFYAGEAFAVCCKNKTSSACSCGKSSCNLFTETAYAEGSSCTGTALSGGTLTSTRSSVIFCEYSGGTVTAFPGNAATGTPAEWVESAPFATCDLLADNNNDGIPDDLNEVNQPGTFELSVAYTGMRGLCIENPPDPNIPNNCSNFPQTNVSQAVCNYATGVLRYDASCASTPAISVTGHLLFIPTTSQPAPPSWALQGSGPYELTLGGFRLKQGEQNIKLCEDDFKDQTAAGGTLTTRQVLLYKVFHQANSFCTGQVQEATGARRMCTDNTFDPTNTTNGPCPRERVGGQLVVFAAGVNPNDATTVETIVLDPDQWRTNSTQSLGCKLSELHLNSGNVPTTMLDGGAASFNTDTVNDSSVKLFVKGFEFDTSPAQRFSDLTEGSGYAFDGCRAAKDGVSQVICRHQEAWGPNGVELGVTGTVTVGGKTLEFIGFTSPVKLSGSCTPGTF